MLDKVFKNESGQYVSLMPTPRTEAERIGEVIKACIEYRVRIPRELADRYNRLAEEAHEEGAHINKIINVR